MKMELGIKNIFNIFDFNFKVIQNRESESAEL